jgi:hypothetical protein
MARVNTIINDFSAGELDPKFRGRPDTDIYHKGCQTLENFIPLSGGNATKRAGTKYIAGAEAAATRPPG